MNNKQVAIVAVVCFILGGVIVKYYFPNIEHQTTEVTKEVIKNNIRTIVRTIENPNGTKETTTETVDNSVRTETQKKEEITARTKDWHVNVAARTNYDKINLVYDLSVERRILGPFYLGARASTDNTIGASVGFEF